MQAMVLHPIENMVVCVLSLLNLFHSHKNKIIFTLQIFKYAHDDSLHAIDYDSRTHFLQKTLRLIL